MSECKCGRPGQLFLAWTTDDRRNGGPHGNAVLCSEHGTIVLSTIERPELPSLLPTLDQVERDAIRRALELSGGNVSEVARALGVHKSRLYRRLHTAELVSLRAMRDSARRNGVQS